MTNPLTLFQLNICSRQWVLWQFYFQANSINRMKEFMGTTELCSLPAFWLNPVEMRLNKSNLFRLCEMSCFSYQEILYPHYTVTWLLGGKNHLISLVELHPLEPIITIISWGLKQFSSKPLTLCAQACFVVFLPFYCYFLRLIVFGNCFADHTCS